MNDSVSLPCSRHAARLPRQETASERRLLALIGLGCFLMLSAVAGWIAHSVYLHC